MKSSVLTALSLFLFLAACGDEENSVPAADSGSSDPSTRESTGDSQSGAEVFSAGDRFSFSGVEFLVVDGQAEPRSEKLEGDVTLIGVQPIGGVASNTHFSMEFELLENGSAEFYSFTNRELQKGINFLLSENGIKVSGPNSDFDIDTDSEIMAMDVHNSENPTHVIVWDGAAGENIDSALDTAFDGVNLGQAEGNFFGLRLKDAHLLRFEQKSAVIDH